MHYSSSQVTRYKGKNGNIYFRKKNLSTWLRFRFELVLN